jgi:hypothetical protein
MRILPIAIALGLLITAPTLVAGQSAKMTGRDQNLTESPSHNVQSAKMHGTTDLGGNNKRKSVLQGRAER